MSARWLFLTALLLRLGAIMGVIALIVMACSHIGDKAWGITAGLLWVYMMVLAIKSPKWLTREADEAIAKHEQEQYYEGVTVVEREK